MGQIGNIESIEPCGDCPGCRIERMIQDGLSEIDAAFVHRAKQLQSDSFGLSRETERSIRREWSAARWNFVREMKPIGCVQPRIVVSG